MKRESVAMIASSGNRAKYPTAFPHWFALSVVLAFVCSGIASAADLTIPSAGTMASPQAPVTDYYLGDDSFHNGAFMLAANFGFYTGFPERKGGPAPPKQGPGFEYGTPDGYEFYLKMGSLANAAGEKYMNGNVYWVEQML